jgi:hypothetical protein
MLNYYKNYLVLPYDFVDILFLIDEKGIPTPNWLILLKMGKRRIYSKRTKSKLHNILSTSIYLARQLTFKYAPSGSGGGGES